MRCVLRWLTQAPAQIPRNPRAGITNTVETSLVVGGGGGVEFFVRPSRVGDQTSPGFPLRVAVTVLELLVRFGWCICGWMEGLAGGWHTSGVRVPDTHMAKLSKQEAKNHEEAERILTKPKLNDDERQFIIEHWQESATHINGLAGAFFTPMGLAIDTVIELGGYGFDGSVLDLCAGMGTLSLAAAEMSRVSRIVCVELNPAYVEVGRKMVPDAEWITASVFEHNGWGMFDHAISNPPFGKIGRDGNAPRYKNGEFEYHVIDIAAHHAQFGTFIIPGMSAGFTLSNDYGYRRSDTNQKYSAFVKQTGITLDAGCGVDTRVYADRWHGVSPQVEIACAEFPPVDAGLMF